MSENADAKPHGVNSRSCDLGGIGDAPVVDSASPSCGFVCFMTDHLP